LRTEAKYYFEVLKYKSVVSNQPKSRAAMILY